MQMPKSQKRYGSVMDYNGTRLSARNLFIINPEGKNCQVFLKVNPKAHSEEVLQRWQTCRSLVLGVSFRLAKS